MDRFVKKKVSNTIDIIKKASERVICELEEFDILPCGYKAGGELPAENAQWQKYKKGDRIKGRDRHFWISFDIKTPKAGRDEEIVLEFITGREGNWDGTNPQGLLYLNGGIVQGLDINHTCVTVSPDKEYKALIYFYMGMIDCDIDLSLKLKAVNKSVSALYYDMKVPYEAAMCFGEDDYEHIKTLKYLEQTCNITDLRYTDSDDFYKSVDKARKYIKEEYYEKICGNADAVVNYIGHTHIDVAWLWTLAQTREKVQRTFATVLKLMDKFPEYVFMSSQPQLYAYLKQEEPELYERVKEKVKQGRWEVEGAMWLEADCNLSSGESLVRQIIHGKRFMRDEFGKDSRILWLPDVFGYSAALPQILKKSGVDKFVTSKISWNETNRLPYDSFMWQGIDGTEIFTYFLTAQNHSKEGPRTETTYVGTITPEMNLGTWERYQQKEYNNETIVTFGYGDGGGGPSEEMLEMEKRLEYGLPGMPKAQMSFAGDFLDRAEKNFAKNCALTGRVPKWVGELYLEFHRGTYTSIAKNKKNNRECEFLCQTAETLSIISENMFGTEYPLGAFDSMWKTILLNQFHDIIPGSSIFEVYEDSDRQYAALRAQASGIKNEALLRIAGESKEAGVLVYNPNSFAASGYAAVDGKTVYAEDVPPMGWKVVKDACGATGVSVGERRIESGHYIILFDGSMNIESVFDKDNGREAVTPGMKANRLCVFEDNPYCHDNWEISNYYKQKKWDVTDVQSVEPVKGDGFGGYVIVRKYMNSTIKQTVKVYDASRRIDFENEIDWHENHVLLKAFFPVNVNADKATYEIQFGNVERPTHLNTSWDAAKFEVCAQKWADISEYGYGVSLLNNCKYGHSAAGSELSLTLIKCGTYPNEHADQGLHTFTYALLPHKGDFRQGGTVNEAYLLNRPFEAVPANGGGSLEGGYSLVSCDSENIIIETVKKAESGKGTVLRLYDAWNMKTNAVLHFGFEAKKISLCDMTENVTEVIGSGSEVKIPVGNYEIVTLLIEM